MRMATSIAQSVENQSLGGIEGKTSSGKMFMPRRRTGAKQHATAAKPRQGWEYEAPKTFRANGPAVNPPILRVRSRQHKFMSSTLADPTNGQ